MFYFKKTVQVTQMRAGRAISFLEKQGFTNLVHLEGDFGKWQKEQRAIVTPQPKTSLICLAGLCLK